MPVIPPGGPLGGAASGTSFDVFCYEAGDTATLLGEGTTTVVGDALHVFPTGEGYVGLVGDADEAAWVHLDEPVNARFTLEWQVTFERLPNDFTRISTDYAFLGAQDVAGAVAGFYFSRAGIAYTSLLGGGLTFLPDSAALVPEGESLTFRLAVDLDSKNVYLYATRTEDVERIGHQLKYVLPAILAENVPLAVQEGVVVAANGETTSVSFALSGLCLASYFFVPNLRPIADAGADQSVRQCNVIRLDGSASFDPEGVPLVYGWRLIDAPSTSEHVFAGTDGETPVDANPPGAVFTDKFYSASLASVSVTTGDVLVVEGEPHTLAETGLDGFGEYVRAYTSAIPVGLTGATYKIIAQSGIVDETTAKARFYPDLPGFYKFDLIVYDGELVSDPAVTVINVVESAVPRGVIPDLSFFWNYLSDAFLLIEGREKFETVWSAAAQLVASELLNLWQIDYNKSLRDIQRLFHRRWLSYNTKVAEPLPAFVTTRTLFGPFDSLPIPSAGSNVTGTTVAFAYPGGTAEVTFTGVDPLTPSALYIQLRTVLLDTPISVTQVTNRVTNEVTLRLTAPFAITVTDETTCSLFTPGTSGVFEGTSAFPVLTKTFLLGKSTLALNLVEDDLLTVGTTTYRIVRTVDDAGDEFPYQRVVVKELIPPAPATDWNIGSTLTSKSLVFWDELVSSGDDLEFEVADETTGRTFSIFVDVLGVAENAPNSVSFDPGPLSEYVAQPDTYAVALRSFVRRGYIPLDDLVVDIPYLQEVIKSAPEHAVLRRNVDFFIEAYRGKNSIRFDTRVWQTEVDEEYVEDAVIPLRLWAEFTYFDNRPAIEGNFGLAAGFTIDQYDTIGRNFDYLSAVRGLWYAYLHGPAIQNIRFGTQILLGLPFAEEAGIIEEIRTDFSPTQGRILVRDKSAEQVVRSYHFPVSLSVATSPVTGVEYDVGDEVLAFAPLVEGVEVYDYKNNPTWFTDYINQGQFYEVEKFFKFLVRIDSDAFTLSSLIFAKSFVQRIKQTSTFALFVVRKRVQAAEISVTDETGVAVKLALFDGLCFDGTRGSTPMFDEPRAAGGGWRNAFDENNNPDDAAPTPPTPDSPITWGFDTKYLCPDETMQGVTSYTFLEDSPGSGTFYPVADTIFVFGEPVYEASDTTFSTPIAWAFDTPLPAGTYMSVREMGP
jgi:hypothetical protein